jgi:hypothetical protein
LHPHHEGNAKLKTHNFGDETLETKRLRAMLRTAEREIDSLKKQHELPSSWGVMRGAESKVVKLHRHDPAFSDVISKFQKTCPQKQVLKIERVQHPALWRAYVNYRDHTVAPGNSGDANEKQVFHGSDASTMAKVNAGSNQCFDRSYTKTHRYGKGVYFARDAKCSSRPRYSTPDESGVQRMYLARVAVGRYITGQKSMTAPPERDTGSHPYAF